MAKVKKAYFCQNCGAESAKWIGKCPSCGEWNTYVEEIISKPSSSKEQFSLTGEKKTSKPVPVQDIVNEGLERMPVPDRELSRVLGGGIVNGSVILLGGEPGIGKSTLLLQLGLQLGKKVLYVSGEESESQIKMRADRTGIQNKNCYIFSENQLDVLMNQIAHLNPDLVIIDSIQTLQSPLLDSVSGSVGQVRASAEQLIKYAKTTGVPVFLIGHITKDGQLAGPKVLEHMVDAVLQFEGDRNHIYRLLRGIKNRFGSTNELGIYEMQGDGLIQVENPSEIFLANGQNELSGVAIGAITEGLRPLLIETQALVSTAAYGTPQRSATGFDIRRLNMLLAVLEKRCGFRLAAKDVFLNMAGGIRVDDPATDLAVVCAILSSSEDIPVSASNCFAGEVGLSGEIRPVPRVEQRVAEAERLGFKRIFVSAHHRKKADLSGNKIEVVAVSKVDDVFNELFG